MQDLKAELVRGLWYVALVGADVAPGRTVHKTLLGEPVLIGRARDGRIFALRALAAARNPADQARAIAPVTKGAATLVRSAFRGNLIRE